MAWDREKKQIQPFQVLTTRKRKVVSTHAVPHFVSFLPVLSGVLLGSLRGRMNLDVDLLALSEWPLLSKPSHFYPSIPVRDGRRFLFLYLSFHYDSPVGEVTYLVPQLAFLLYLVG